MQLFCDFFWRRVAKKRISLFFRSSPFHSLVNLVRVPVVHSLFSPFFVCSIARKNCEKRKKMAAAPTSKNIVEQYRGEFEEKVDDLLKFSMEMNNSMQQRIQQLNENMQSMQPQMAQRGDELVKSLQNVEPLQAAIYEKILKTFSWIGIMQMGIFLTAIISSFALHPLVGLVLGSFWSAVMAYALLPALAFTQIMNAGEDERGTRFKLLGFALAEGLLVGYLTSQRYLSSMQPLAFITPLVIALVAQQVPGTLGESAARTTALGVCLGCGFLLHLLIALPLGQLSAAYILLTLLYTVLGYCAIQFYVKFQTENAPAYLDHLCMLGYVFGALVLQGLVFLALGGAK